MPYKTPYGDHYHLRIGCNGAFIPCGTNGLRPCSVCCGTGSRQAQPGDASGTGIGGEAPGRRPAEAQVTGQAGADLATRYAEIRKRFSEQVQTPTIPAPDSHGSSDADEKASEEPSPEALVSDFDKRCAAIDLTNDHDGSVRFELVKEIEEHVEAFEWRYQKDRYRTAAQVAWNERHPDATILRWGRKDAGYVADGPRGVTYEQGNGQWTLDYQPKYVVLDKVTGEDVSERILACHAKKRELWEEVMKAERMPRNRVYAEGGEALFYEWIKQKRMSTHNNRRYQPPKSLKHFRQLSDEFEEETHYRQNVTADFKSGRLLYTDEEQDAIDQAYERYNQATQNLEQMMVDYGVSPKIFLFIESQSAE